MAPKKTNNKFKHHPTNINAISNEKWKSFKTISKKSKWIKLLDIHGESLLKGNEKNFKMTAELILIIAVEKFNFQSEAQVNVQVNDVGIEGNKKYLNDKIEEIRGAVYIKVIQFVIELSFRGLYKATR